MRRAWKSILLQLGAIIVFFVLVAAIAIAPWGDGGMRERADAIPIPASWQVTRDNVVPFKLYCLEKSGCPSLERVWKLDHAYSKEELEAIFAEAGVGLELERECEISARDYSSINSMCRGGVVSDGYSYTVYQRAQERGADGYSLSLLMRGA